MPRDTFRFGRKRLESEGTTDEPQRTHFLFSRTYAGRIGRFLPIWIRCKRSCPVIPSDSDGNVSKARARRMNRNARIFCFLVLTLAALGGCSSEPPAKDSKKAGTALDRIQGKAQVLVESSGTTDAALNAGGPSVYLWEGMHRYRLFLRTPVEVVHGSEYIAEGVLAQKAIDEIGDPDQGKNGYPLESSCRHVVTRAWPNLSFDTIDAYVSLVRARVKRYPARPLFLVTRIQPVTSGESSAVSAEAKKNAGVEEKSIPEIDRKSTRLNS